MESKNRDKRNFIFMLLFLVLVLISSICVFYAVNKKDSKLEGTTFDTPEEAYIETEKILNNVSSNLNKGIKSAEHLEKFDKAKNKIFK